MAGESGGPEGTIDGAGGLRNSHVRTGWIRLSSIYQRALLWAMGRSQYIFRNGRIEE